MKNIAYLILQSFFMINDPIEKKERGKAIKLLQAKWLQNQDVKQKALLLASPNPKRKSKKEKPA